MSKPTLQLTVLLGILGCLIQSSESIYPAGCSYSQSLALNTNYYIYNYNYPNNYTANTDCLWVGTSPAGSVINIYCKEVVIPPSTGCTGDRLRVSLTGDQSFSDQRVFCGTGTLSLTTTTNKVAMELIATYNSPGGRLYCTLNAVQVTPSCDCGLKQTTRIVGGTLSGINEYTMMAGLIDYTVGAEVICGCTIISNRYVLTAAHCLRLIETVNMGVLVGDWNISTGYDTSAAALYKVASAIAHPNFNVNLQTNDIAIIKTATVIAFNLYVGPACLPFKYRTADFTGQTVTYLGWGQLMFNGPKSETLYKVDVSVISNYNCQQQYPSQQIISGEMCTYTPGKDACQGDSGGPALWMDNSVARLFLLGITSYGYACSLKPGITTRVTSYLDWIVSMSPEVSYCVK